MSSASPRADEDSRGSAPENRLPDTRPGADPAPGERVRIALGALLGVAVTALAASTFLPVLRISVDERVVRSLDRTGWDEHGGAMLALALFAASLLRAALRGSTAAAIAIALTGFVAVLIAAIADLPDVGDVGTIGQSLRDGRVGTGLGAYAETLGGVLLLACGGLLALRTRRD